MRIANCLPWRQFAWNVETYFLFEKVEQYFKMSSAEYFTQHVKQESHIEHIAYLFD